MAGVSIPNRSTLEGILERIVFFNEENNFTVGKLQVARRKDLVSVVGNMPCPNPGETLRLRGEWVNDPKFGQQFRVESCLAVLPATITGIEKYLGSGLVKGIGPIMAKRLVSNFGLETLDIIEGDQERLLEVEGIGPIRAGRIAKAWQEQKEVREVMVFLQGHGVSSTYAVKIYKAYRDKAINIIKQNPYRLALDISGIGFKTADRIAQTMGIDPASQIRAEAGIIHVLSELVDEGHVYYPHEELMEKASALLEIDRDMIDVALRALQVENRVTRETVNTEEAVYLTPLYLAEVNTGRRVRALLEAPRQMVQFDADRAIESVQRVNSIKLAEMQKEAIRKAICGGVLVVTGGPGTGKTTLVNSLIRIQEGRGQRIALASPTGRAAKKLSEVTGREAATIHRLLEFSPSEGGFKRHEDNPLNADVVIIDEISMVDILLMNHLLKAIPLSATLVLVGDVDQLPSVGPGNVLNDLIASGRIETVRLTQVFRQAQESRIITNAHRVNRGQFPDLRVQQGRKQDFYFIEREDPEKVLAVVKELCSRRLPRAFGLDPVNDIQVITPMRKGIVGVARLNTELQQVFNPKGEEITRAGRTFRTGDKVIQTKNDYQKEVFNGDIGRIELIDLDEQIMRVDFDDRPVGYDWGELDELDLAYAISIHKAQGSEYPAVVVPLLSQHYIMLQRNLLYTAITRARKLVILVGSKRAIALAVRNNKVRHRYSGLRQRLGPDIGL